MGPGAVSVRFTISVTRKVLVNIGGLIGIYMENVIPGPHALLVPAFVTGSVGIFYMACRRLLKNYIKKPGLWSTIL